LDFSSRARAGQTTSSSARATWWDWVGKDFTIHGKGRLETTFDPAGFNPLNHYWILILL